MKLTVLLCLIFVLVSFQVAQAKKKGSIIGKFLNKHKKPKPKDDFKSNPSLFNKGDSVHKQDIPGSPYNQRPQQPAPGQGGIGEHGSYGGYPAQGGYPGLGGYPAQPGRPGQGGYPAQGGYPGQGGYPAQGGYLGQGGYPAQPGRPGQGGYPAQGWYPGHGGYPAQVGYPGQGGYPAQGGYGQFINQNPNNPIRSPHYGGSYGSYVPGRGSPYSHAVQAMGYVPSEKSKGFGRSAVMAAAGGAMAGMALGYGLGNFPRPHFHFHSPEEEYYYNYYMYRRYGLKSSEGNDFRGDNKAPPVTYELFMSSCMKRKDLLPTPKNNMSTTKTPPTIITTASTSTTTTSVSPSVSSNMTRNVTVNNSASAEPTTIGFPKPDEVNPGTSPGAPTAMAVSNTDKHDDDDDDTVSIVEIGYPALIEQLKVRRCLELYIVHSEKYLRKSTTSSPKGGGEHWKSSHWLLLFLIIVIVIMT